MPSDVFIGRRYKDSVAFIEETGEFAANLVSANLSGAMNATSVNAPRGVSEFEYSGLTATDALSLVRLVLRRPTQRLNVS